MAQQKLTAKFGSGCGRHGHLLNEYSEPEDDGRSDADGGHEGVGVAGGRSASPCLCQTCSRSCMAGGRAQRRVE